jgi:uncharacterized protein YndB with AHSA1/START domain
MAAQEQPAGGKTITVTHRYNHPPEAVYDAWLDPASARQWLFTTPDSEMVVAEVDARVGGKFRFVDCRKDMGDAEHVGEYLELDRPRRIVFTFAVPQYDPRYSRVAIDIAPTTEGCELTLSHDGVPDEWQDKTKQGWGMILGQLEEVLS